MATKFSADEVKEQNQGTQYVTRESSDKARMKLPAGRGDAAWFIGSIFPGDYGSDN